MSESDCPAGGHREQAEGGGRVAGAGNAFFQMLDRDNVCKEVRDSPRKSGARSARHRIWLRAWLEVRRHDDDGDQ